MNTPRENAEQDQRRRDTESDIRYWRHREWEAAPLPGPAPLPNPAFQAEVEAKVAADSAKAAEARKTNPSNFAEVQEKYRFHLYS